MNPHSKNKKRTTIFVLGSVFGFLLVFYEHIVSVLPHPMLAALWFPGKIGLMISDTILWPICELNTSNICRGLALDGGPLAWVEWAGLFGGMILGYGTIFLLSDMLYLKIKTTRLPEDINESPVSDDFEPR